MRNTIKANVGYHVRKVTVKDTGETRYLVMDGEQPIFLAEKRNYEDYLDEKEQNECFYQCEVFTTIKGNQFIFWRDEEIDADYITMVERR